MRFFTLVIDRERDAFPGKDELLRRNPACAAG
jgi:hypothetical protein